MISSENLEHGKAPRRRRARILAPRDFIKQLQEQYPAETAEEIRERYLRWVRDNTLFDDRAIETLVIEPLKEWLQANVGADELQTGRRPRRAATPQEQEQRAQAKEMLIAEMATQHEMLVEAEVAIRLLEYQTTYGKPLGDCTRAECRRLSTRYGAFFAEIAKRLRPGDHVRQHLSEAELQAIARTHRMIGPKADR